MQVVKIIFLIFILMCPWKTLVSEMRTRKEFEAWEEGRRHICMLPQSGGISAVCREEVVGSQERDLKSAFEGLTLIFRRSAHLMSAFVFRNRAILLERDVMGHAVFSTPACNLGVQEILKTQENELS